jgi:aryl-alcohol dehydrogenase-like predicted oxidoreductase
MSCDLTFVFLLFPSPSAVGTMTFGRQNTLEEGAEQLAHAYERYGVNFLDTAELYPVPGQPETQGKTDEAVSLFLKTVNREDVVVATKVSGRNPGMDYMPRRTPGTACEVNAEQIADSVDASLKRLGTDYVDLLQIHWPDRYVGGLFGQPDFLPDKYEGAPAPNDFAEQLAGLQEVVRSGKVRYVGVSNETPYGVCSFVNLARQFPDLYPKIVSIQNSYSLVVRKDFEAGLAEACYHHDVGLLAYSPLAGGTLTGKYRNKKSAPEGSRFSLFPGFMERYLYSQNEEAVNAYADVAERAGLTPTQLALSWCYHNPLVTSSIIGATTMEQLEENLRSYDVRLSEDVQEEISRTYKKYTDPTKARNS